MSGGCVRRVKYAGLGRKGGVDVLGGESGGINGGGNV
jgi:hypothetical protein